MRAGVGLEVEEQAHGLDLAGGLGIAGLGRLGAGGRRRPLGRAGCRQQDANG
jgi:hypothetical protein